MFSVPPVLFKIATLSSISVTDSLRLLNVRRISEITVNYLPMSFSVSNEYMSNIIEKNVVIFTLIIEIIPVFFK